MKAVVHNVFFPKMFSQFDKPLHFQEISHIEERIILLPRGSTCNRSRWAAFLADGLPACWPSRGSRGAGARPA